MEFSNFQAHLQQLLQQRAELDAAFSQNRELYWKVQGAIEYLSTIGVTLPEPEVAEESEVESVDAEEEAVEE